MNTPAPDITAILRALFSQLQANVPTPPDPRQAAAGIYGGLGGPSGAPYGMYGAFYGGRMPQVPNLLAQVQPPQLPQVYRGFGSALGSR